MPMMISPPSGDMPPDLLAAASETDAEIGDGLAGLIQLQSPANPKVLNALAAVLADFAKVMGMEVVPEKYTAPTAELDPDLVRLLAMAEAASGDHGKPFPVAMADVADEKALTAITAHLTGLVKDPDFAAWLEGPSEGEGEGEGEGMEIEIKAPGPKAPPKAPPKGGAPMGTDDLFAARMRR